MLICEILKSQSQKKILYSQSFEKVLSIIKIFFSNANPNKNMESFSGMVSFLPKPNLFLFYAINFYSNDSYFIINFYPYGLNIDEMELQMIINKIIKEVKKALQDDFPN